MSRGLLPFVLLALVAGCDHNDDLNDGGVADLSVVFDDAGNPLDLSAPGDLLCVPQTFGGFFGVTPSERRFDCSCGCTVDPFTGSVVAGFWNSAVPGATFAPSTNGLSVSVTSSDGGVAIGALNSLNPASPFYIDGDFDLLIDYQLVGTPPQGAHLILSTLNETLPGSSGTYRVERERDGAGTHQYSAELGGISPVKLATSATQGTLELQRTGFAFRALADGTQVTQFLGGAKARMTIVLTAALDVGCTGPGCELQIVWRNLRLKQGALVDRR